MNHAVDKQVYRKWLSAALIVALLLATMVLTPSYARAASAFAQTAASSFNAQSGIQLETSSEGGQNVAFIDNGDYIRFDGVDFGSGASAFFVRVASNASGGAVEARLGSVNGTLAATCTVPATGGWQSWTTVTCSVSGNPTGTQTLFLKFTGGAGNLFNMLWFQFSGSKSAFVQTEAEQYDAQLGTQLEASSEGGQNVSHIDNGDYIRFNNINFGSGANAFVARVASQTSGGSIEVRLGSVNGTLAGTCTVSGTGGWQTWITTTCAVSNISGVHDLFLKFVGGAGNLFNLNWFRFDPTAPQPSGGDVVGKVIAGYQGWFNATGDGSPNGGWIHWSKNSSAPGTGSNVNFDLYPDLREYSKTYATSLQNLNNGQQARLFSSYDQETVNKHFEWMQTYNIDGAALQRFGASTSSTPDNWRTNRDSVAVKVKNAAESYNRKFYIMYDISGMDSNTWDDAVKFDWTNNILSNMNLTSSSAYAKQDGKIVVCIWGIGFNDRPGTASESSALIQWFKDQNIYVIGGVPTYWRTGVEDSKSGFLSVYQSFDMLSPWYVGRFGGLDGADHFKNNLMQPDVAMTNQQGIDYQPVLWPGFSWYNLHGGPQNQIPRLHGDFIWRQAYNAKSLGINTGYVAMFDEYDEGTAIAKAAENASMIPANHYFLTLDADGVAVSSDFYLRLTGDINRMLKGQIPATAQHPTSHQ
ncbi:carbohydrate-binding protein [Paenibacillus sp. FSL H8-0548]|uniref:carbohydrate-binding protein n=1 Tax=Paenibacillus sp. FSL H8-0548 TaxID=1920422 RepID=UPI00096C39D6|nr:carbohydrate-binding protein [Paenibacillus sp. FSL H8-0548]OMF24515.1 carbohydrate-binding protein [Paenibacillus sp. FSL H8-0548]